MTEASLGKVIGMTLAILILILAVLKSKAPCLSWNDERAFTQKKLTISKRRSFCCFVGDEYFQSKDDFPQLGL